MTNGSVTDSPKARVLLVLAVAVGILLSTIRALVWSKGNFNSEASGYALSGPLVSGAIAYAIAGRKSRRSASRFASWFVALCLFFLLMELVPRFFS